MTAQKTPAPAHPLAAISVIVPVYNVQDHVGACLASLRAQHFTDFEAIVIDDGSTDDSLVRLRAAIGDDPRFAVIAQDNRGLSGARNAGLDIARGAFIAFLDGDDRYDPDFLGHMHTALTGSDADWVACGLRNMHADGHSDTHSARHDRPELDEGGAPTLLPLASWDDAIAHFPSAWNKLYRRSLIEGLRFDEGTWFEDHAFFLRAAARSKALLHLPEPLYLQTRGRDGQITAADTDRVFEQFPVLDTLATVLEGQEKPAGQTALPRLAHRLIYERSTALHVPERRARFVTAARDWLARHHLPPAPGPDCPPSWALELGGTCPLSVIIPWDGQEEPLRTTLETLAGQMQRGFETLIVGDDPDTAAQGEALARTAGLYAARGLCATTPGPGPARNTGLDAARGEMVVFADAGDRLMPAALAHWTDTMLREKADLGFSQFRIGFGPDNAVHPGIHNLTSFTPEPTETGLLEMNAERALALHAHSGAKIFRRAFLVSHGLGFDNSALCDWRLIISAALSARRTLYFAWPGIESSEAPECRRLWTAPAAPADLARLLDQIREGLPQHQQTDLPEDWQKRLYARALLEKYHFSGLSNMARVRFVLEALVTLHRRGWHRIPACLDQNTSRSVRVMVRESIRKPRD